MSTMTTLQLVILFAASIMAGFANAVAGGGTFFTFPALVAGGLPNLIANATSAVAISPGHAVTTYTYRRELARSDRPRLIGLLIIAVLGAIGGAWLLTVTPEETFKVLVPYLVGFATLAFAFGPSIQASLRARHAIVREKVASAKLTLKSIAAYGAASVYGGYFGAGQGIVLLTILMLNGVDDIQEANALKNLISTLASLVAVVILAFRHYIHWDLGVLMIVGAGVGGFIGGKVAKSLNKTMMRALVISFGTFLTAMYFYKVYFAGH